jgi:hypothetical protein
MPPSPSKTRPRDYFGFPACDSCWEKPCIGLRYGAARPDECLLVHRRLYNTQHPCPFAAPTFDETARLLRDLPLQKLDRLLGSLIGQLSFEETQRFDRDRCIAGFNDAAGRIDYLRHLWEARIIAVIRAPHPLDQDAKIKAWLKASETFRKAEKEKPAAQEQPEEAAPQQPKYAITFTVVRKNKATGKMTPLKRAKCKVTVDGATKERTTKVDGSMEVEAAAKTSTAQVEILDLGESTAPAPAQQQPAAQSPAAKPAAHEETPSPAEPKASPQQTGATASEAAPPEKEKAVTAKFIFPATPDHKQYVNLPDNGANEGMNLTLKVKVENGVDGRPMYWKATADPGNSKRNDPKTGLKENDKGALGEFSNGVATCSTKIKDGNATVIMVCGPAGGDTFTVEVGAKEGECLAKVKVVNWRKLWYELMAPDFMELEKSVRPDGTHLADYPNQMHDRLKTRAATVFVEFELHKSNLFTAAQAPAGSVFKSEQLNYPAGSSAYVLTDHTFKSYPVNFDKGKSPRSVLIKLCHRNFYYESRTMDPILRSYTLITKRYTVRTAKLFQCLFLPLSAENGLDAIKTFKWKASIDPKTNPTHPAVSGGVALEGDLTSANIEFISVQEFAIKLPDRLPTDPGSLVGATGTPGKCPIKITLSFEGAAEGLGLAGQGAQKGELLSFFNQSSKEASIDVMLHEVGHLAGLTVYNGIYKPSPGLAIPKTTSERDGAHLGNTYIGKGHSGSHCAFGLTDIDKAKDSYAGSDGTCIMFGENSGRDPSPATTGYCPECTKHFKARELDDLGKNWIS